MFENSSLTYFLFESKLIYTEKRIYTNEKNKKVSRSIFFFFEQLWKKNYAS